MALFRPYLHATAFLFILFCYSTRAQQDISRQLFADDGPPDPYPFNISTIYKGDWKAESTSSRLGFSANSGVYMYRIRNHKTDTRDLHFVEGEMVIYDGNYPSESDLRYLLQGIYLPKSGKLHLFANDEKWNDRKTLGPLIPEEIELKDPPINTTLIDNLASRKAAGGKYSSCATSFDFQMSPLTLSSNSPSGLRPHSQAPVPSLTSSTSSSSSPSPSPSSLTSSSSSSSPSLSSSSPQPPPHRPMNLQPLAFYPADLSAAWSDTRTPSSPSSSPSAASSSSDSSSDSSSSFLPLESEFVGSASAFSPQEARSRLIDLFSKRLGAKYLEALSSFTTLSTSPSSSPSSSYSPSSSISSSSSPVAESNESRPTASSLLSSFVSVLPYSFSSPSVSSSALSSSSSSSSCPLLHSTVRAVWSYLPFAQPAVNFGGLDSFAAALPASSSSSPVSSSPSSSLKSLQETEEASEEKEEAEAGQARLQRRYQLMLLEKKQQQQQQQQQQKQPDFTLHQIVHKEDNTDYIDELYMKGTIRSQDCHFVLRAEATPLKFSVFFSKALNYAVMVIVCSFFQIVLMSRQMEYSSTQARALKVALPTIAFQAMIDSYLFNLHVGLGLIIESLFSSFIIAAMFNFSLFSLQLRFLLYLWKARHPEAFAGGWERMQAELRKIAVRFGLLMFGSFILVRLLHGYMPYFLIVVYAFWVPQIILNAVENCRHALKPSYVVGMSITRLAIPLYMYGCPANFLGVRTNWPLCIALASSMAVQVLILLLQYQFSPRFFVPSIFLPKKYNYHRPIPLLRKRAGKRRPRRPAPDLEAGLPSTSASSGVSASPSASSSPSVAPSPSVSVGQEGMVDDDEGDDNEDMCPICYCEFETEDGRATPELMVTPCDHVFHTHCLLRWMDQKMECPTCRGVLPSV